MYGKEDLDNTNNTSILDATINYLIETERFNAELFWWTPDVIALILMLHLKLKFLFIFFFDLVYYFYPSIIFRLYFLYILYVYFFCSQLYRNIYMYAWWLQIFCLMCKCWYRKKTYFQTAKFFKNISFVNKIVVRQKIKVFYENLISLIKNVKELNSLKFLVW